MTKNLAVFVSGRGSNLQAILNKIDSGYLNCKICAVISDKLICGAFEIADKSNIQKISVSKTFGNGFHNYSKLAEVLTEFGVDLIVLAGFLQKIPDEFIEIFKHRIINIHPALLPSFGGKGMYGHFVHEAVFNKSCKVSGATVHFVDSVYDNGFIIAQKVTDIADAVDADEIAKRVLQIEHELLPYVIKKFCDGKIKIENQRAIISP